MLNDKTVCVVMPAYNAERTLKKTYEEIPLDVVDHVILVDDGSSDGTFRIARDLSIDAYVHLDNVGYGANQKTCYQKALQADADIVVMLHPDYQYSPKLIAAMASMLAYGVYDVVLGSRILGEGALSGGMPLYKYVGNRALTFIQNLLVGRKHSEYHTGYRGFTAEVLGSIPYERNSNDFLFDNQILVQIINAGFRIGELSCPAKYFRDASSIGFSSSVRYGLGCVWVSFRYFLHRLHIRNYPLLMKER